MARFAIPATLYIEATDEMQAKALGETLELAVEHMAATGKPYELQITGVPHRRDDAQVAACERCGGRRHDPQPCPTESGVGA